MADRVLVVGATGLIGRAYLEHAVRAAAPETELVALSRRPPLFDTTARHLAADVSDVAVCAAACATIGPITHLVYAAVTSESAAIGNWQTMAHVDANVSMLRNVLTGLEQAAPGALRHVTLLQGTKSYGSHFGTYQLPARESDPRTIIGNFYYEQEDLLRDRAASGSWSWTILRPQVVIGFALGASMNVLSCIGVYAALCRELGVPFRFPGTDLHALWQAADTRLIAAVIAWAQHDARAANQIFNVNNGDCSTWESTWLDVGSELGLRYAPSQPYPLAVGMPRLTGTWERLARREGLVGDRLDQLASWEFCDYVFTRTANSYASRIKLFEAGFDRVLDSRDSFTYWLRWLQRERYIPAFSC